LVSSIERDIAANKPVPAALQVIRPRPFGCGKSPEMSDLGKSFNLPGGVFKTSW
jgi:hypothetical protein